MKDRVKNWVGSQSTQTVDVYARHYVDDRTFELLVTGKDSQPSVTATQYYRSVAADDTKTLVFSKSGAGLPQAKFVKEQRVSSLHVGIYD